MRPDFDFPVNGRYFSRRVSGRGGSLIVTHYNHNPITIRSPSERPMIHQSPILPDAPAGELNSPPAKGLSTTVPES